MEVNNFVGEVALKALIEHENTFLISLDSTSDKWDLPGGRMHDGETPQEGLAREVKEEMGIDIIVGAPFYTEVGVATRPGGYKRFFIVYKATLKDPKQKVQRSEAEITDARWITKEEVSRYRFHGEYERAIRQYFGL